MTKSHRPVLFTPLERTKVRIESAFRDAPVVSERVGRAMDRVMGAGSAEGIGQEEVGGSGGEGGGDGKNGEGKSLYQVLGWDDEDDDGVDELVGF